MEKIKFKRLSWVEEFLEGEGINGEDIKSILDDLSGAILENLMRSKELKKVNNDPAIYYFRKRLRGINYRFMGPKDGDCIYLLHAFKKKSREIPQDDLEVAIKRAETFTQK